MLISGRAIYKCGKKENNMAAVKKIGIGVVGSGTISYTYLSTLTSMIGAAEIIGCSDLIPERAERNAALFGCKAMTNDEIYECDDIQIVLNLTNVWSHYEVTKAALEHGKHVYSEKMAAENFFHKDYEATLVDTYGLDYEESLVVEGGVPAAAAENG